MYIATQLGSRSYRVMLPDNKFEEVDVRLLQTEEPAPSSESEEEEEEEEEEIES